MQIDPTVILPTILLISGTAFGAVPPDPPEILEPTAEAEVSGEDVHMVTGAFFDGDADDHLCTDWEIVDPKRAEVVWSAPCVAGFGRTHVHLGDGSFAPLLASDRSLRASSRYRLRVRHRDDGGRGLSSWSDWSERDFRTSAVQAIPPMVVADALMAPEPRWLDDSDADILLAGDAASLLRLETSTGRSLLEIRALDGAKNLWIDAEPSPEHLPVRVVIESGSEHSLSLPPSRLCFRDEDQRDHTIYLPVIALEPGSRATLWISSNGSSHPGDSTETVPDFSRIARANPVPWIAKESGYIVELVAEGFQLPVALEFVSDPGDAPEDPLFYVAELYGRVRVVARNGTVSTYASELLNFDPFGNFPGAGERGLADLALDPESGDLFVTLPYHPAGGWGGLFYPRVMRLVSSENDMKMERSEVVLDLVGEPIGPSHQISNISIGPDRRLYVHVADGNCIPCARELSSGRGKILRLELDGMPATDNPYYDMADGITWKDYVYASGFRNPFGGAWRAADLHLYEVENGPNLDRFARVEPGVDYGWAGLDADMTRNAIYNWREGAAAPVNVAFIQPETFGGSGFPAWKRDTAYVTESGATWATGPRAVGKRIGEFVLTGTGELGGMRRTLIEYDGSGKATVAALAAGPDGLYFSDLYDDDDLESPISPGARIFRIRHVGSATFEAEVDPGDAGCAWVRFRDRSSAEGIAAWQWRFGDGGESAEQNPVHHYDTCGVHAVELRVETGEGELSRTVLVDVDRFRGSGLRGEYFHDESLGRHAFRRVDPAIDFDWQEPPLTEDGDGFSVRWEGWIHPRFSQPTLFRIEGAAGARLWIDRTGVIDAWNGSSQRMQGRFELEAGRSVSLRVEIRSSGSPVRLLWSSESLPEEVIPGDHFDPEPISRRRAVRR